MSSTHTPGPWKYESVSQTIRTAKENYWIASLDSWDGQVVPNKEADGKLIAAAPELLAAIQMTVRELALHHAPDCKCLVCKAVHAAISKAKEGV